MKKIALLLAAALCGGADTKQKTTTFDGQTYILKFVNITPEREVNEYYLPSESPENWSRQVSSMLVPTSEIPYGFAKRMEQNMTKIHPDSPPSVWTPPGKAEAYLMVLNWAGDKRTTSEFSAFRFKKHKRGIQVYEVTVRPYQAKLGPPQMNQLAAHWKQMIPLTVFPDIVTSKP